MKNSQRRKVFKPWERSCPNIDCKESCFVLEVKKFEIFSFITIIAIIYKDADEIAIYDWIGLIANLSNLELSGKSSGYKVYTNLLRTIKFAKLFKTNIKLLNVLIFVDEIVFSGL